jgi:hypothetical protein
MFFNSPGVIIPVVAIICWMIIKIARIKNGTDTGIGWHDRPRNSHVPPMFDKMLEKAMQERDAEIKELRERIEVLEKIVTDNHASVSLASEIDKLRDAK